jgi:hypothetical protein
VHYDKDGNRRATYRTATKEGAQIEPRNSRENQIVENLWIFCGEHASAS